MFARAAVLVVLGFIAYGAMLTAPFRVMDDRISIVENPVIKSTRNAARNKFKTLQENMFQNKT